MKETSFIKQNKEKWEDFERELNADYKDPDKLSNILIQITDDLSYSRTFYPNRSVRVYLNNFAQKIFRDIYKTKKDKSKKLISFWTEDLPLIVFQCRKQLFISFLIFLISAIVGALSTKYDKEFPTMILGADYIQMTLENIEKGDPMGVYKKMGQMDMFLSITLNNVLVAFRTFILGVFFALGTLIIMVYNGIMIGTFQYFFYQQGLFIDSFLTIWLHGTLEISSIIIAGASGLVLGRGLVFPGTLSRFQAFQISAKQGLKIFLGIVPILVFAALIEGFVTRYTDVPGIVKGLLIFTSVAFIAFYFVYYPFVKGKALNENYKPEIRLQPFKNYSIEVRDIKTNGQIFNDLFFFYRKHFGKILGVNLILSLVYISIVAFYFREELFGAGSIYIPMEEKLEMFFNYFENKSLLIMNTFFLTLNTVFVNYFLITYLNLKKINVSNMLNYLLNALVITGILNSLFFLPLFFAVLGLICFLPIVFLSISVSFNEDFNFIHAFFRSFQLLKGNFGKMIGLNFTLVFIACVFLLVLSSPFIYLMIEAINMSFNITSEYYSHLSTALFMFFIVTGLGLILPVIALGQVILYYSLKEINDASELRRMISRIKEG